MKFVPGKKSDDEFDDGDADDLDIDDDEDTLDIDDEVEVGLDEEAVLGADDEDDELDELDDDTDADADEDVEVDADFDADSEVTCPYCGETITVLLDPGSGSTQDYVEDCEVCCNPWQVTVRFDNGVVTVQVAALDA